MVMNVYLSFLLVSLFYCSVGAASSVFHGNHERGAMWAIGMFVLISWLFFESVQELQP